MVSKEQRSEDSEVLEMDLREFRTKTTAYSKICPEKFCEN